MSYLWTEPHILVCRLYEAHRLYMPHWSSEIPLDICRGFFWLCSLWRSPESFYLKEKWTQVERCATSKVYQNTYLINLSYLGHSMADVHILVYLYKFPDIHSAHILCIEVPDKCRDSSYWCLKNIALLYSKKCSTVQYYIICLKSMFYWWHVP